MIAWLTSVIFSTPILFFFHLQEVPKFGTQCWIDFSEQWQWQLYMSLVSLSIFIIPAIIIAVCYTIITVTIWRLDRQTLQGKVTDLHFQEKPDTSPTNSDLRHSAPRLVLSVGALHLVILHVGALQCDTGIYRASLGSPEIYHWTQQSVCPFIIFCPPSLLSRAGHQDQDQPGCQ